jgi:hypothetical protein
MVGDSNVVGIDILGKQGFLADSFRMKKMALVAAPYWLPEKASFFPNKMGCWHF